MKSNSIRWLPLALAGIISVVLTWFGLMGSAFSQTGWQNPIAVTLIWLLPLLSLPALVTYSLWKKVPPAALWGLVLMSMGSIFVDQLGYGSAGAVHNL